MRHESCLCAAPAALHLRSRNSMCACPGHGSWMPSN